jgi:pantoate--beta-alanine ligase
MVTATLDTVTTVAALRARIQEWCDQGDAIALVPTMGALHNGHGALIAAAAAETDRVITTIFVNPTQFGPGEDFAAYPRDADADGAFLAAAKVDLLYAPATDEMYPDGFATSVSVSGLADKLCGAHRPGHFDGVTTVVAKLLAQAMPDTAYFGEKDWQQLCVIRRLARDLDLPVTIASVPTVREADGLAVSSRNAYLSAADRAVAPALYRTLSETAARIGGGDDATGATSDAANALLAAGFASVDYVTCADAETLETVTHPTRSARVFAAADLGPARLIDNVPVV